MTSPLRAEVCFVSLKEFINLKWGTRDPVAFRDTELGLIRLRAFGVYNIRVIQPVLFINSLVGTQGIFIAEEVEDYLNKVIVSRLNDYLGETLDTMLSLPGRYDEIANGLTHRLREDFARFGLQLTALYINSITPPPEVQKAIDDKSKLGVFNDLDKLLKLKAATALENASSTHSEAGSSMAMGLGLLMPALFTDAFNQKAKQQHQCPECSGLVDANARFCPHCGHQLVIFDKCQSCQKNLPPNAKFCPRCGSPVSNKATFKKCSCGAENLFNSVFCNHCGAKL